MEPEGLKEMNCVICSPEVRRAIRARAIELGLWTKNESSGYNSVGLWVVGGPFFFGPSRGLVNWCSAYHKSLELTPDEFLARMEVTAKVKRKTRSI